MEAPDKIYLNSRHPEPYWFKDKQVNSDIEYIRKDALLEWLNKELTAASFYYEKMKHVTGSVGNNSASGKIETFEKVIGKLNSM